MHGQGNNPFRKPVGGSQRVGSSSQLCKHLLTMSGHRIIDHGRNLLPRQIFIQSIPVNPFQDERVLMKNMMTVGSTVRRCDLRMSRLESVVVIISSGTSGRNI